MSCYVGQRDGFNAVVTVDGKPLDLRLDLRSHSPTGFEWGYGGSGPAQLALAILAHHLRDDQKALKLYQHFKWAIVVALAREGWAIDSDAIDRVLAGEVINNINNGVAS